MRRCDRARTLPWRLRCAAASRWVPRAVYCFPIGVGQLAGQSQAAHRSAAILHSAGPPGRGGSSRSCLGRSNARSHNLSEPSATVRAVGHRESPIQTPRQSPARFPHGDKPAVLKWIAQEQFDRPGCARRTQHPTSDRRIAGCQ